MADKKPEQGNDAPETVKAAKDTPAKSAKTVLEAQVTAAIESWTANHLRGSDFSRDTAAWNHFQKGLPALIQGIVKEVEKP